MCRRRSRRIGDAWVENEFLGMNIIETQNLTRRFGRMEAVHELTLSVPEGSQSAHECRGGALAAVT